MFMEFWRLYAGVVCLVSGPCRVGTSFRRSAFLFDMQTRNGQRRRVVLSLIGKTAMLLRPASKASGAKV
jgi:hypothetical protein